MRRWAALVAVIAVGAALGPLGGPAAADGCTAFEVNLYPPESPVPRGGTLLVSGNVSSLDGAAVPSDVRIEVAPEALSSSAWWGTYEGQPVAFNVQVTLTGEEGPVHLSITARDPLSPRCSEPAWLTVEIGPPAPQNLIVFPDLPTGEAQATVGEPVTVRGHVQMIDTMHNSSPAARAIVWGFDFGPGGSGMTDEVVADSNGDFDLTFPAYPRPGTHQVAIGARDEATRFTANDSLFTIDVKAAPVLPNADNPTSMAVVGLVAVGAAGSVAAGWFFARRGRDPPLAPR